MLCSRNCIHPLLYAEELTNQLLLVKSPFVFHMPRVALVGGLSFKIGDIIESLALHRSTLSLRVQTIWSRRFTFFGTLENLHDILRWLDFWRVWTFGHLVLLWQKMSSAVSPWQWSCYHLILTCTSSDHKIKPWGILSGSEASESEDLQEHHSETSALAQTKLPFFGNSFQLS